MKTKFKTWYENRQFSGEVNRKKSLTTPGQDVTPQELIRFYVKDRQSLSTPVFSNYDYDKFSKMSIFEKHELLKSTRAAVQQEQLNLQAKRQELETRQRQIESERLKELQEKARKYDAINLPPQ